MVIEGPTAEEEKVLEKHFSYIREMTEKGVVQLAGRTTEKDIKAFGLVVLRADSEQGALEVMQNDPGIKLGVMWAELSPFKQNVYS
ncbi:MAG: YciI family protein [Hyphomicrobiales bacterium]|nr:YciI family protein [Hyphomicrobiales bacterium]